MEQRSAEGQGTAVASAAAAAEAVGPAEAGKKGAVDLAAAGAAVVDDAPFDPSTIDKGVVLRMTGVPAGVNKAAIKVAAEGSGNGTE